jgi:hypothetical protein
MNAPSAISATTDGSGTGDTTRSMLVAAELFTNEYWKPAGAEPIVRFVAAPVNELV